MDTRKAVQVVALSSGLMVAANTQAVPYDTGIPDPLTPPVRSELLVPNSTGGLDLPDSLLEAIDNTLDREEDTGEMLADTNVGYCPSSMM